MVKKLFAPGKDSALTSLGLLALRLFFGLTMLLHHGMDKLNKMNELASGWADPLHVGHPASFAMTLFAEVADRRAAGIGIVHALCGAGTGV